MAASAGLSKKMDVAAGEERLGDQWQWEWAEVDAFRRHLWVKNDIGVMSNSF